MQTNLEKKAITKRKELEIKNTYDPIKEYSDASAKKGGEGTGSLVDHTLSYFDTSTGGGAVDQEQRKKQSLYSPQSLNRYTVEQGYGEQITIDTSLNVGQYIIE